MDYDISLACVFAIVLYYSCLHYCQLIISFSSSKSLFSRLLDPLAVDFELPSGPHHPPKPNKTEHKTKNNNTSPAHILDAWQRGGFREAYGDPPPPSGVEACQIQAADPQSSSAEFCNPLMKSKFRPPAALAGPPAFHPRSIRLFASIPRILR